MTNSNTVPPTTKEAQYQRLLDIDDQVGRSKLGLMMNQTWHDDPRRLGFTLARYKFVAKMFDGWDEVLEVGCGDAFPSRIVQQAVKRLSVCDFDQTFIDDINSRAEVDWPFAGVFRHDVLDGPPPGRWRGIYALDVLEHIQPELQHRFLGHLVDSLDPQGSLIIGMPSLESQAYASPISKEGHVNCQTLEQLRATMAEHFHTVFVFSMNDEVLHVGYGRMAQYLLAIGCGPRCPPALESGGAGNR
ncbi:MAG: class I SAM-dependent methyltransferase [Azospirillaceae bacterium]|nr:class I SAM-dependent methyltransferase [Azospirillaceae bacterium]